MIRRLNHRERIRRDRMKVIVLSRIVTRAVVDAYLALWVPVHQWRRNLEVQEHSPS
ncbi:hypothetical protein BDV28DRAFT_143523 [Aspergillus coremiiformis]|uniref:Uncharacterized protein n=1 Tax=Aspergillus coremiiformis TaxID=138285 RepID=A0A5N6YSK6_9EURO|nr:hypothetical protein BDV28DRAFT_143523 [Aspergillus coremiiformis]